MVFNDGLHFELELAGTFPADLKQVVKDIAAAKKVFLEFQETVNSARVGGGGGGKGKAAAAEKQLRKRVDLTEKLIATEERIGESQRLKTSNPLLKQLVNANREKREQLKLDRQIANVRSARSPDRQGRGGTLSTGQDTQVAAEIAAGKALDKIDKERLRIKTTLASAAQRGIRLNKKEKDSLGLLSRATSKLVKASERLAGAKDDVGDGPLRKINAEAVATERLAKALDKEAIRKAESKITDSRGNTVVSLRQEEQARIALAKLLNRQSDAQRVLNLAADDGVKLSNAQKLAIGGLTDVQERLLRAKEKLRKEEEISGDGALRKINAQTAALRAQNAQRQREADLKAKRVVLRRPEARDRLGVTSREQQDRIKATIRGLKRVEDGARKAKGQVAGIDDRLKKVNKTGNRLGFTFRRLFGIFAAFAAVRLAVRGFIDLIKEGVRFNAQIESAELGIGALITAVGKVSDPIHGAVEGMEALNLAQGEARRQMGLLRVEALKTSATYQDLLEAFKTALAPGVQAGLDLDEIRALSISISQAAGALGLPQQQLAEEIRSLLQGTITPRNTRIATALGITNEDIQRAKEAGELAEFLEKRFAAFGTAADKALNTFAARLTNAKDALSQLVATGQVKFFDDLKDALLAVTETIADFSSDEVTIKKEAVEAAERIGEALSFGLKEAQRLAKAVGFETLEGAASTLASAMETAFTFLGIAIEGAVKGMQTMSGLAKDIASVFTGTKVLEDGEEDRGAMRDIAVFAAQWTTQVTLATLAFVAIRKSLGFIFGTWVKLFELGAFLRTTESIKGLSLVQRGLRNVILLTERAAKASFRWVKSLSLATAGVLALAVAFAFAVANAKDLYDEGAGEELTASEFLASFIADTKLALQTAGRLANQFLSNMFFGLLQLADQAAKSVFGGIIDSLVLAVSAFESLTGKGKGALKELEKIQKNIADSKEASATNATDARAERDSAFRQAQLADERANSEERGRISAEARIRAEKESGKTAGDAAEVKRELDNLENSVSGLRLSLLGGQGSLDTFANKLLEIAEAARVARAALEFSARTQGLTGPALAGAQVLDDSEQESLKQELALSKDIEAQSQRLRNIKVQIAREERDINADTLRFAEDQKASLIELEAVERDRVATLEELGDVQVTADGQTGSLSDLASSGVDLSISDDAEALFVSSFDDLIARIQSEIDKRRVDVGLKLDPTNLAAANSLLSLKDDEVEKTKVLRDLEESRALLRRDLAALASLNLALLGREATFADRLVSGSLSKRLVSEQRVLEARERLASLERSTGDSPVSADGEIERLKAQLALELALLDAKKRKTQQDQQAQSNVSQRNLSELQRTLSLEKQKAESQFASAEQRRAATAAVVVLEEQLAAAKRRAVLEDKERTLELDAQTAEIESQKAILQRGLVAAIKAARDAERDRLQTIKQQSSELRSQALLARAETDLSRARFNADQGGQTRTDGDAAVAAAQVKATDARLAGLKKANQLEYENLLIKLDDENISSRTLEHRNRVNSLLDSQAAKEGAITEELRQQEIIAAQTAARKEAPVSEGFFQALENFSVQSTDTFQNTLDLMTSALNGFSATASGVLVDALAGTGTAEKTRQAFGQLLKGLSQQIIQQLTALGTSKLLGKLFGKKKGDPEDAGKELSSSALKWAPVAATLLAAAKLLNKGGAGGAGIGLSSLASFLPTGGYYGGPVTPRGFHDGGAISKVVSRGSRAALRVGGLGRLSAPGPVGRGYAVGGGISPGGGLSPTSSGGGSSTGGASAHPFLRPSNLHPADRVPIWAAVGEYMMQRASVSKYGTNIMKMINEGRIDPEALKSLALQVQFAGRPTPGAKIGFQTGGQIGGGTSTETITGTSGGGGGSLPVGFIFSDESQMDQLLAGGEPAMLRWLEDKQQFLRNLTS